MKEPHPPVAVVMPVFNTPSAILEKAVDSVMAQRCCGDVKLFMVDDGSTSPDTLGHIERYTGSSPVTLLRQTNKGQGEARNYAANYAHDEGYRWLAFLDADDIWFPYHLNARLEILADFPDTNFMYGAFIDQIVRSDSLEVVQMFAPRSLLHVRDASYVTFAGRAMQYLRRHNIFLPLTVMMTTDLFRVVGGFEPGLVCSEDWLLWRRALSRSETNIRYCPWPTAFYRTYIKRGEAGTVGPRRDPDLNQSAALKMPLSGNGFHLNTKDAAGGSGEYLDEKAAARAKAWLGA